MIKNYILLAALALATPQLTNAQCTCFSTGTGADSAYHATSSGLLAGGTYNFSSFTIDAGVTVSVTGSAPLVIRCTGAVVINGTLTATGGNGTDGITSDTSGVGGIGVAGGMDGGNGTYSSSVGPLPGVAGSGMGAANNQGEGWSGGGGGGFATPGDSSGGVGGFGGAAYGMADLTDCAYSSGGGGGSGGYSCGSGGGGAGGGFISINAASIFISSTGSIHSDGGNGGSDGAGNCGGGGGGSGGSIWMAAQTLTNNGNISAIGGSGGASSVPGNPYYGGGANGSDGRVRIDYASMNGNGTITPSAGFTNSSLVTMATFAFPVDTTCAANAQIALSASPAGGVFSGTGVNGSNFDPSQATANAYNMVTYTYTDSICGTMMTAVDSIYVGTCLGMSMPSREAFQLIASPNPSNGEFHIDLNKLNGATNLHLLNSLGQEMRSWSLQASSATVLVDHLVPGIYFITAENDQHRVTRRVVVQ